MVLRWCIDAYYNTHGGCRFHTGSLFILDQGYVLRSSLKFKLNMNSSTEVDLVVANENLSVVLWSNHFIES